MMLSTFHVLIGHLCVLGDISTKILHSFNRIIHIIEL